MDPDAACSLLNKLSIECAKAHSWGRLPPHVKTAAVKVVKFLADLREHLTGDQSLAALGNLATMVAASTGCCCRRSHCHSISHYPLTWLSLHSYRPHVETPQALSLVVFRQNVQHEYYVLSTT